MFQVLVRTGLFLCAIGALKPAYASPVGNGIRVASNTLQECDQACNKIEQDCLKAAAGAKNAGFIVEQCGKAFVACTEHCETSVKPATSHATHTTHTTHTSHATHTHTSSAAHSETSAEAEHRACVDKRIKSQEECVTADNAASKLNDVLADDILIKCILKVPRCPAPPHTTSSHHTTHTGAPTKAPAPNACQKNCVTLQTACLKSADHTKCNQEVDQCLVKCFVG